MVVGVAVGVAGRRGLCCGCSNTMTEVPVRGGVWRVCCQDGVVRASVRGGALSWPVGVRAASQLCEGIDRVVVLIFHWSAFLHD